MSESQKSYRQILKATSLFSGVQIFGVLLSIARSKFAAIFIGSAGIGIVGVLNSTINVIAGFTRLGLDVSAVKEIAAFSGKDEVKVVRIIKALHSVTWITGVIGAIVTVVLSSWLSQIAFGNDSHSFSFVLISIAILFNQLASTNIAILQGLRKLKKLAKSTLWASFCSFLVIIPLYYYYGIQGIVPVIILSSIFTFLFSWYYARVYNSTKEKMSFKETLDEGKDMVKLGFVLSMGNLATILSTYAIQIFITNKGGIDEVGFYNAAFLIINAYVGVVFSAMSKDYFPRLSALVNIKEEFTRAVNQQAYVAVLLLTPIIILFLTFIPFVIKLLLTSAFLPIIGILTFAIIATLFKAVSWSIGYILVAKGDSKLYIQTEVGFSVLLFAMSILGYIFGGLTGVGICYFVYYLLYLVGVKLIVAKRYNFKFNLEFYKIFVFCLILCLITFLAMYIQSATYKYGLMIGMIVLSSIFTLYSLNKKTDLLNTIKSRLQKRNRI